MALHRSLVQAFEEHDQRCAAEAEASCRHVPIAPREGSTGKAPNVYPARVTTVNMLRAWLDQGDAEACKKALDPDALRSDATIDRLVWIELALHALQLGHADVAKRMVTIANEQSALFSNADDTYLDMNELKELLSIEDEIPHEHQRALAAYMLGDDDALCSLMTRDAAPTHRVLERKAPLLAAFFVSPPVRTPDPKTDRAYLAFGVIGVGVALGILAMLAKYGSSWAGPSSELYQPRRAAHVPETQVAIEATHQSDATFELRLALLRARPCVCARSVNACAAITAFDRSPAPSCALLEGARLVEALTECTNDEAREEFSRACPDLRRDEPTDGSP